MLNAHRSLCSRQAGAAQPHSRCVAARAGFGKTSSKKGSSSDGSSGEHSPRRAGAPAARSCCLSPAKQNRAPLTAGIYTAPTRKKRVDLVQELAELRSDVPSTSSGVVQPDQDLSKGELRRLA
jgi:hypothetical protein